MKVIESPTQAMAELVKIDHALEESTTIEQLKPLHDQVVELLARIKAAGWGCELAYLAAKLKLVAERKMGRILRIVLSRGGDHKSADQETRSWLERWGISKDKSYHWQWEADVSPADFADFLCRACDCGRGATSNGLYQWARMQAEAEKLAVDGDSLGRATRGLQDLTRQGQQFPCIFIGATCVPRSRRRASGCRIDPRVARLPIMAVAAPKIDVYLKVVPESPQDGAQFLREWGLSVKARLARPGAPLEAESALRPVYEVWLWGVRDAPGGPTAELPRSIQEGQVFFVDPAREMWQVAEELSTAPYLDVFGSEPFSEHWAVLP